MYLDEVIAAQRKGQAKGIVSICSAHPWVLKAAMQSCAALMEVAGGLLIEATCNQVNQYGGYTGMTPQDFVAYVHAIAEKNKFSPERIMFGGDHLGPNAWQDEPASLAMEKSLALVKEYVQAGFTKIHLDASMRLGDDPTGPLSAEIIAQRTAEMAKVAEASSKDAQRLRYVIGTEVPVPGGARGHDQGLSVTSVQSVQETIEVNRTAFSRLGLESTWERVCAIVVQPGVEFGDDFVMEYQPEAAKALSSFIETQPMVFEAHSTDYQSPQALKALVKDHFAILKVGPVLTFSFREAVFTLAMTEDKYIPPEARSNIIQVLDEAMLRNPAHWQKYYHGTPEQQAFKRKFSLSDRIRYYWNDPLVQGALNKLLTNTVQIPPPLTLLSQFFPVIYEQVRNDKASNILDQILLHKTIRVLEDYHRASGH